MKLEEKTEKGEDTKKLGWRESGLSKGKAVNGMKSLARDKGNWKDGNE